MGTEGVDRVKDGVENNGALWVLCTEVLKLVILRCRRVGMGWLLAAELVHNGQELEEVVSQRYKLLSFEEI